MSLKAHVHLILQNIMKRYKINERASNDRPKGIATQAEDLIAGGVEELIHVGLAGGINQELNIGQQTPDIVKRGGKFLIIVLKEHYA